MYPRRRDGHSYDSMEARALESEARNVTGNSRIPARASVSNRKKKIRFGLHTLEQRSTRSMHLARNLYNFGELDHSDPDEIIIAGFGTPLRIPQI